MRLWRPDLQTAWGTLVTGIVLGMVLDESPAGGISVYQFDFSKRYCYYYAHLLGYAAGLREGQEVKRSEVIRHLSAGRQQAVVERHCGQSDPGPEVDERPRASVTGSA